MRHKWFFRCATASLAYFAAFAAQAQVVEFRIDPDREDCLYRCGETAVFTVTVTGTNSLPLAEGKVTASLDNFGTEVQSIKTYDLANGNPFHIEGSLADPGFLRLTVEAEKVPSKVFGVGFEPERIKKGSPSPSDFDSFWRGAVKELDSTVPSDPRLVLVQDRSGEAFNFWRISFATWGGTRVYGYLSMPKDASAERKYPARVQVPAAGDGRARWTNDMEGAPDEIRMLMTVHPYEPPFDLDELEKRYNANSARLGREFGQTYYPLAGIAKSREDYYFYRAILGINRAVDWLAARPEVDLSRFRYYGISQGGGFGIYLMGLNRHFTKGALFVPAMTDMMGYMKGRQSGWPRIVERQAEADKTAAARNVPYFDAANFASRITCPVRIVVGFADCGCPPCAVYAAYNEIASSDKRIIHGIGMTHSVYGGFYWKLGEWIKE